MDQPNKLHVVKEALITRVKNLYKIEDQFLFYFYVLDKNISKGDHIDNAQACLIVLLKYCNQVNIVLVDLLPGLR